MAQADRKSGRLAAAIIVAIAAIAAISFAAVRAGGVRELLVRDPPRADYTWLRKGLNLAEDAADRALEGTRRIGTQAAARALQNAIRYSRASARSTGTEPIPPEIRKDLEGFFPEEILDKVRWAYPNPYLDLGTVMAAWYQSHGGAVTLEDTIVFSTPYAAKRRFLWAHELTHVMQYEELGLEDFARVYVTNPELLERQAWENANRIEIAIRTGIERVDPAVDDDEDIDLTFEADG